MQSSDPLLNTNSLLASMYKYAKDAMLNAHAPFSQFFVGSCIRTPDDQFFIGCNCENSSFGASICAEGGALSQMILNGARQIQDIMVIASTEEAIPPCGICRQRISDHMIDTTQAHMVYRDDETALRTHSLPFNDLLPYRFKSTHFLKNTIEAIT